MKISLANVTVNDEKAYNALLSYMVKIGNYKGFSEEWEMNVYVDDNCDFIGFESPRYRIQFVNNAHKLKDIQLTPISLDPVTYGDFKAHILSLGADMPF